MLNVAVLDDYQQVTHKYANWRELNGKINLKVFSEFIDNEASLVKHLSNFNVLCLMRERTKLTSSLIKNYLI